MMKMNGIIMATIYCRPGSVFLSGKDSDDVASLADLGSVIPKLHTIADLHMSWQHFEKV